MHGIFCRRRCAQNRSNLRSFRINFVRAQDGAPAFGFAVCSKDADASCRQTQETRSRAGHSGVSSSGSSRSCRIKASQTWSRQVQTHRTGAARGQTICSQGSGVWQLVAHLFGLDVLRLARAQPVPRVFVCVKSMGRSTSLVLRERSRACEHGFFWRTREPQSADGMLD